MIGCFTRKVTRTWCIAWRPGCCMVAHRSSEPWENSATLQRFSEQTSRAAVSRCWKHLSCGWAFICNRSFSLTNAAGFQCSHQVCKSEWATKMIEAYFDPERRWRQSNPSWGTHLPWHSNNAGREDLVLRPPVGTTMSLVEPPSECCRPAEAAVPRQCSLSTRICHHRPLKSGTIQS